MPLRSEIGRVVASVALAGAFALTAGTPALAGTELSRASEVRLLDLSSVRRLFGVLVRQRPSMTEGARVGAWADFTTMAAAVVGGARLAPITFDDLAVTATGPDGPRVAVTSGLAMRDEAAFQLLALGYSARETADVVSGRISVQALDNARRMIAVGLSRDDAANYLDGQYQLLRASREPVRPPRQGSRPRFAVTAFDGFIEKYARLHNVESSIVRAIIATESAFNPAARSHAGAIGLMQLMPGTARELGVNPFIPEENIEGGVRYFAQLLRMFGRLELALIAYNGGPGFAERYARGQTALYGETRDYVRKVMARLQ